MATGGPDFVRLPTLFRGEEFRVQFGPGEPPVDWSNHTLLLTLDSPNSSRVNLTNPAVAIGGVSAIFSQPDSWSESIEVGVWEYHFWVTPPGGQRDHVCWGTFEVANPKGGSP
jgi:hypothetical protein